MCRFTFIAVGFCIVILLSPYAHATGNVLLPSSGNSNSPAPNLGIAPPPPPASAPSTNTPTPQPYEPPAVTPPPIQSPLATPSTPDITSYISPIDANSAKSLPVGATPTQIIHQPDNAAILLQSTAKLPNTITLSISGRSVFGSNDVVEIGDKLGLNRDQIGASCYLSVSGIIQTDKDSAIVDGGLSPKITVRYSGTIQGALLSAQALCTANRLPPGSGFITQIGNRYIVPLQPVNCVPPTRQVSQMIITYDGTEKSGCVYQ